MKVVTSSEKAAECVCSALVTIAFEASELSGSVADLNEATGGVLQSLADQGEFSTKPGKVSVFHRLPGVTADCVVVVGGGNEEDFDQGTAFRCGGAATRRLAERARECVSFSFGQLEEKVAAAAVAGAMNGCVGQDLFRAEKKLRPITELQWLQVEQAAIRRGRILGESVLLARELVNLPANYLYPETFAKRAAQVAVTCGLELEVWDELRLRREGCGAMLAVSAGSARPPRLLVMRYAGREKRAPLALVGKGVTFDSGGLSLKPSDGMLTMKGDMAGAATVLATMQALAQLQVDTPVVGLVGLVENMVSGTSYKLGDVLTARGGKTIEIHNTDAEGRLVLADVLNVAHDEKPAQIIDLATLTGACVVALGTDVAGLMSNDEPFQSRLQAAADQAGELVWPLPMFEQFGEQIQSKVADIKNMGEGRWGGAITAAKFLEEFVDDSPWVHIDIAGPAFYDSPKPFMDAGGSGALVRTLVALAEDL